MPPAASASRLASIRNAALRYLVAFDTVRVDCGGLTVVVYARRTGASTRQRATSGPRFPRPMGVWLVHKPPSVTSFDALKAVRPPGKACHGGALDPFATGLLPVLVGPAV